ncbi:hypothetical protein ACP70R_039441 [Stipagrostis hirtigluma subsp. patula]
MAAGQISDHLLGRVSRLVATCTRHVSRATRRLLRRRHRRRAAKEQPAAVAAVAPIAGGGEAVGGADKLQAAGCGECEAALWSRRILMGERCQPLDFAGAIHYDSFGRRVARPPTPRSASSLSCRSSDSVAVSDAVSYYLEDDV